MSLGLVPHQLKTFATANAVSPSFNYYIDPKDFVEPLAEALLKRRFCLLFGHRQSDKTTAAMFMLAYLRSYTYQLDRPGIETSYMTLQNGVDFTGRSSFWRSFCRTLRTNYPQRFQYDNSEPQSSATFITRHALSSKILYLSLMRLPFSMRSTIMTKESLQILLAPYGVVKITFLIEPYVVLVG